MHPPRLCLSRQVARLCVGKSAETGRVKPTLDVFGRRQGCEHDDSRVDQGFVDGRQTSDPPSPLPSATPLPMYRVECIVPGSGSRVEESPPQAGNAQLCVGEGLHSKSLHRKCVSLSLMWYKLGHATPQIWGQRIPHYLKPHPPPPENPLPRETKPPTAQKTTNTKTQQLQSTTVFLGEQGRCPFFTERTGVPRFKKTAPPPSSVFIWP